MSTFEDDRYRWRETYFVLFPASRRPTLKVVEKKLAALSKRYSLENLGGDEHGKFESLTLISPDDFAALDICYTGGAEVLEHVEELVQELAATVEPGQKALLKRLKEYDGRFDVLHFEQVGDSADDDEPTSCSIPAPCWRSWTSWPGSPAASPSIRSREPF